MRRASDCHKDSVCRNGRRLHDWRETDGDEKEYREDCRRCGERRTWKRGIGGFSRKWANSHQRDALRPFGEDRMLFIEEYGQEAYERATAKRKKGQDWNEITDEAKDDLKFLRRKTFI